jgi:tetratricopeptide (TPR) repeat protein
VVWVVLLTGLTGLTVWNGLHSRALAEAQAAYEGRAAPADPWPVALWQRLWPSADIPPRARRRAEAGGPMRPDYIRALQRALDHLDRHPSDGAAARLAALCLSQLEFAAQAEPYYRIARDRGRPSLEDLHVRALALARANLRDEAIAAYQEILGRWDDDPLALQRLAAIYYSRSQYKETLKLAEKLARSPEARWAVAGYSLIGTVHHDEQRPRPAVEAEEEVLRLDPNLELLTVPADLFFADFAEDLIDINRAADARRHLERALRSGDKPALVNLLGAAYYAEGQEDEAERCWKHATELDPRFDRPWLNLGKLALRRGRLAEAATYLETAHAIDRESFEPLYQLSLVYRRLGRTKDAERFARAAAEANRKRAAKTGSTRVGMGADVDESP